VRPRDHVRAPEEYLKNEFPCSGDVPYHGPEQDFLPFGLIIVSTMSGSVGDAAAPSRHLRGGLLSKSRWHKDVRRCAHRTEQTKNADVYTQSISGYIHSSYISTCYITGRTNVPKIGLPGIVEWGQTYFRSRHALCSPHVPACLSIA